MKPTVWLVVVGRMTDYPVFYAFPTREEAEKAKADYGEAAELFAAK